MARPLRYVQPGQTIEITVRVMQSRRLLRPSKELNEAILAVLGRALYLYDVELHGFAVLSNHVHYLMTPATGLQLARFMQFVNGNISKAVGRIYGWQGPLWERRYRSIPVLDEVSQVRRLRYVVSQGSKEGLVASPMDWPGVHCARALVGREELWGTWLDRSALFQARRNSARPDEVDVSSFETRYAIRMTPIPCWRERPTDEYRAWCAGMVAVIEDEARRENEAKGRTPLGADLVCAQDPTMRPERTKRSPAPLAHGDSAGVLAAFRAAYRRFVDAFRAAAERLRSGQSDVEFPRFAFPPAAPFVDGPMMVVVQTTQ